MILIEGIAKHLGYGCFSRNRAALILRAAHRRLCWFIALAILIGTNMLGAQGENCRAANWIYPKQAHTVFGFVAAPKRILVFSPSIKLDGLLRESIWIKYLRRHAEYRSEHLFVRRYIDVIGRLWLSRRWRLVSIVEVTRWAPDYVRVLPYRLGWRVAGVLKFGEKENIVWIVKVGSYRTHGHECALHSLQRLAV